MGSAEAAKRRNFGVVAAMGTAVLLAWFLSGGFSPAWYLILAAPLWGALQGFMQAREKT